MQNWFQNRRAKAKQERKQEEYEARRAAERTGSEPDSPTDVSCVTDVFEQDVHQRMKPSSASFSEFPSLAQQEQSPEYTTGCDEDSSTSSDNIDSPFAPQRMESHPDRASVEMQSPVSMNYPQSDNIGFSYSHTAQAFSAPSSMPNFTSYGLPDRPSFGSVDQELQHGSTANGLPSPDEPLANQNYRADHYLKVVGSGYPSAVLPYFQSRIVADLNSADNEVELDCAIEEEEMTIFGHAEQNDGTLRQGTLAPSFKSPPPPANLASRRNIPRPANLQVATSRGRSYNTGPKTGIDGFRRADPTSPATAMRRIVSAGGNMAGRIQKQSAGPRSPLFLNRNTEAYLQYHSRSPVGVFSAAFSGTTPPTPMTPAVMTQGGREPTVSSTCSDDEAFMLGHGMESLKTPPETPGVLGALPSNFTGQQFHGGMDFTTDQPLLTPYFQTEFPDLSLRHVPSYVEMSDSSLPSTPLYPNIITHAAQEPNSNNGAATGHSQYDWDTNESITSTKSSPGQPRSQQIQFTQNMTPQDYNLVQ